MLTQTKSDFMKVFSTREYTRFKDIKGNRGPNPVHLKKLRKSMEVKPLISPIIVNERFEIIDGQHRFYVRQELDLPIQYIIAEGYGLEEVQLLNSNTKNWTPSDFLDGYIELGMEDYILFKKFKDQFNLGHTSAAAILSLHNVAGNSPVLDDFKNGNFKIPDYKASLRTAEKIQMVSKYYPGYNTRSFILAMMQCFDNQEYNHATFLSKLEYQSVKMVRFADKEQALTMIEEIYNYKNSKKINLRFKN